MNRFELLKDEEILISTPKHWKNYIIPTLLLAVCGFLLWLRLTRDGILLGSLVEFIPVVIPAELVRMATYAEALALVAGIGFFAFTDLRSYYTQYYVTNKRIIISQGILNVDIAEMALEKCETVNLYQKLYERFFNSGDILCISAGASIYLDDVYDARKFKQTIINQIVKTLKNDNENEDKN